jgi:hypothetical protein
VFKSPNTVAARSHGRRRARFRDEFIARYLQRQAQQLRVLASRPRIKKATPLVMVS